MKASGSGILLIAALAVVAAAVAAWQWSAGEAPRPGQTTEPGAADRQTPGADAKPTAGGTAIAPERSEVPTPPAAAPDEPAAEPADADAAAGKFAVRGRVVDVRGNGIADAHVHVTDQPVADLPFGIHGIEGLDDMLSGRPGDASTAADGTFELRVPDAGPFRLVATHPDHPRGDYRGEATADVEGVVITLRDGARITGSVLGAPPEAESIVVFARRLKGTVEKATSGALLDVSGLVEAVGAPLGAARAEVDAERRFELRGLDPDSRYSIWAANATTANGMPLKSTPALEFAAGTLGVELRWREPLRVTVRAVDAETGAPIEQLGVAAGFVKEIKMLGMTMPIPATKPLPQSEFEGGVVWIDQLEVHDEAAAKIAVEIRAEGRRPWIRHDIPAQTAGLIDLGTARLERAAIVIARVLDAGSGDPIAGATVELVEVADPEAAADGSKHSISFSTSVTTNDGPNGEPTTVTMEQGMSRTTDARGETRITAEFAGTGRLDVQVEGYAPAQSETFTVPATGEVTIELPVHRGGTVRVTAIDAHGVPEPHAAVRRTGPHDGDTETEKTDENGVCTFARLAVGEHAFKLLEIDAKKSGGFKVQLSGMLDQADGTPVQVADGAAIDLTLTRPLRGEVTGFVMLDGNALDRASVRLFGNPNPGAGAAAPTADEESEALAAEFLGSMLGGLADLGHVSTTDVDGRYRLDRVPVGSYRIVVNHDELAMPEVRAIEIVEGDNRVDVGIVTTSVRGRILDADGTPLVGATVHAMPSDGGIRDLTDHLGDAKEVLGELFGGGATGGGSECRSGEDGTFELRGVRAGIPLTIVARARQHIAGSQSIDAVAAGTTRSGVEIALATAGCVRISAVGVDNAMAVKLRWAGPPGADAPRNRDALLRRSRVTLDDLVPGTWTVELQGLELPADVGPRTVSVAAGETVRVDFGR